MNSTKRVLILSYYFPPYSGIGSVRMTSVAKYLPEYGWTPSVYAADWQSDNCDKFDPSYGSEVKQFVIPRSERSKSTFGFSTKRNDKLARMDFLVTEMRNRQRWVRAGKKILARLQEEQPVDAIIATYPAMQALTLGSWAAKRFNIPWIADFRDIAEESHGSLLKAVLFLERRAVQSSNAITTISQPLANSIQSRYTQALHVIPNGFDQAETTVETNRQSSGSPQDRFEIVYTGVLYPPNHPAREGPKLVFEALDQLSQEGKIELDDFLIKFVGTAEAKVREHFIGCQSESQAVIEDWLPRAKIREIQLKATLLLCLGSRHMQGILTGKLFEYLNARRPILSIPNDQDGIGKLLEETGAGETADNRTEVAEYLLRLHRDWREKRSLPDVPYSDEIEKYNWRNQTERFAIALNEIT